MTRSESAFTKIELLVTLACIGVIAALILPALNRSNAKKQRIKCVNNLKQSSLALKIFAPDDTDRYPYQAYRPITNNSPYASITLSNTTRGDLHQAAAWAHWGILSNELGSPKILQCPGNQAKRHSIATDWGSGAVGFYQREGYDRMHAVDHSKDRIDYRRRIGYDLSTSYFLCLNADETIPAGVLAGDANLNWNPIRTPDFEKENPVAAGVQVLETTNHFNDLRWAIGRDHPRYYQRHDNDGNLAFTDGSVMHANTAQLRQVFQASTNAHKTTSHWLVVPQ